MNGLKPHRPNVMWTVAKQKQFAKIVEKNIHSQTKKSRDGMWKKIDAEYLNVSCLQLKFPLKSKIKTRKSSAFQFKQDNWQVKALAQMNWMKKKRINNQLNSCEIPMKEDQVNWESERSASCVSFSKGEEKIRTLPLPASTHFSIYFYMPFCWIETTDCVQTLYFAVVVVIEMCVVCVY